MSQADELLTRWRELDESAGSIRDRIDKIEEAGEEPHYSWWESYDDTTTAAAEAAEGLIAHIESTGELPSVWIRG